MVLAPPLLLLGGLLLALSAALPAPSQKVDTPPAPVRETISVDDWEFSSSSSYVWSTRAGQIEKVKEVSTYMWADSLATSLGKE